MRRLFALLVLAGCSRGEHAHYGGAVLASHDVIVAVDRNSRLLRLEDPFEEAEVIAARVHARRAYTSAIFATPDGRRAIVRADTVAYSDGDVVAGGLFDVGASSVFDLEAFLDAEFPSLSHPPGFSDVLFIAGSPPVAFHSGSLGDEQFAGLLEGTDVPGQWSSTVYVEGPNLSLSDAALALDSSGVIANFQGLLTRATPGVGFAVVNTAVVQTYAADGIRDANDRAVFFEAMRLDTRGTRAVVRRSAQSGWQLEIVAILTSSDRPVLISAASSTSAAFIAEKCGVFYCVCSLHYVSYDGAGWTTDRLLDFDRWYFETHSVSANGNRVLHGEQVAVLYERDVSGVWTSREILRVGTYGSNGCAVAPERGHIAWTSVFLGALVLVASSYRRHRSSRIRKRPGLSTGPLRWS